MLRRILLHKRGQTREDFVCYVREGLNERVRESWRGACEGLGFYREHEGKRYCVLHFPGDVKTEAFEKAVKSKLAQHDYNFRGTVFPEGTSDFQGVNFDVNTNFTGATFIGDADFSDAQFSGEWTNFSEAHFSGARTNFSGARFSGARTNFSGARFSGEWTDFSDAQFSAVRTNFLGARFSGKETDFSEAHFSGEESKFSRAHFSGEETDFTGAQFGSVETFFRETAFVKEVVFTGATFRNAVTFLGTNKNLVFGSQAWAWYDHCRIEKPELLTCNNVQLHPGWFINVDVRKVDFTDVQWYGLSQEIVTLKKRVKEATDALKKRELKQAWEALKKMGLKQAWYELTATALDKEIEELEARNIRSPHTLLAQACRRLSANAEENREYPLANEFHYWSMDALRKEGWRQLGLIGTLYWVLSGYGVRAGRALVVLLTIAVVFAVLYMIVGHPSLRVLPFAGIWQALADVGQAVMYSLGVMARLRPEPIPKEVGLFQILVTVEGILGPLQIALLALAIRRKVMR